MSMGSCIEISLHNPVPSSLFKDLIILVKDKSTFHCPLRKMSKVIEIRWFGRGGQGVVLANQIVALSALKEGKFVQAFPEFGPERRGAPVRGYTRLSDSYIDDHSPIYNPDVVVVIDPSLALAPIAYDGLKEWGIAASNTTKAPNEIRKVGNLGNKKLFLLDARGISDRIFKTERPIYNTAMIGALIKALGYPSLRSVQEALSERFTGAILEVNIAAVKAGFEEAREV